MRVDDVTPADGWDVAYFYDRQAYRVWHRDMPDGGSIDVGRAQVMAITGRKWRHGDEPSWLDQRSAAIECVRRYLAAVAERRLQPPP